MDRRWERRRAALAANWIKAALWLEREGGRAAAVAAEMAAAADGRCDESILSHLAFKKVENLLEVLGHID